MTTYMFQINLKRKKENGCNLLQNSGRDKKLFSSIMQFIQLVIVHKLTALHIVLIFIKYNSQGCHFPNLRVKPENFNTLQKSIGMLDPCLSKLLNLKEEES